MTMLPILLSRFSRVRLCATPEMAAHQTPPSLGFSRQEHWSGLPFPSPMHESESEVSQLCPTLSDPMDCSLPGSSVRGSLQARTLERAATPASRAPPDPGLELESRVSRPPVQAGSLPLAPPDGGSFKTVIKEIS